MTEAAGPSRTGIDLRCSTQTRELGEQLAGSATASQRFVLVELPRPWPKKIEDHPVVTAAVDQAREQVDLTATRLLAVRRADDTDSDRHRIIDYRAEVTEGGFDGFVGRETDVDTDNLVQTLAAVLAGNDPGLEKVGRVIDLLLCTHGSRDRCCGALGSLLVMELEPQVGDGVRLWRTSHTGGHRFAPTGMTFPDGLTWGFVDGPTLLGVLDRSLPTDMLAAHLRGCSGFGERPAQIADAVLLARHGWTWLDHPRTLRRIEEDGDALVVEAESGSLRGRVRLSPGVAIPVPTCTEPLDAAKKTTAQYVVDAIDDL